MRKRESLAADIRQCLQVLLPDSDFDDILHTMERMNVEDLEMLSGSMMQIAEVMEPIVAKRRRRKH